MTSLFEAAGLNDGAQRPLADRLRPTSLGEVVGQEAIVGVEGTLTRMLERGRLPSLILWGPPGTGKTTIAQLLADATALEFEQLSAIFSGVQDLRKAFDRAKARRETERGTLLFVDEIHRFNRAQQDSFLPYMEDGTITLVGATTENPSFELNAAVLSRASVLVLERLGQAALEVLLSRAEAAEGCPLALTERARAELIAMADGDGRYLLGLVEQVAALAGKGDPLGPDGLSALIQKRAPAYDKDRDGHYNLISALHEAVRGSDPDAALYWFARMLEGGEDPLYLARRLIRMASEDIGLADPTALMITGEATRTYERLGSPEGELALAHAVIHLATAPKSNASYAAFKAAKALAQKTGSVPPPNHAVNAPTALMKEEGRGDGYVYDHGTPEGHAGLSYLPHGMERPFLYQPPQRGYERTIAERLEDFRARRQKKQR